MSCNTIELTASEIITFALNNMEIAPRSIPEINRDFIIRLEEETRNICNLLRITPEFQTELIQALWASFDQGIFEIIETNIDN